MPHDCPHSPDCDPSVEVIDPYANGPDGPTALVCLTHDQDHPEDTHDHH